MNIKWKLFGWSIFLLISILFCVLLSFRPIPKVVSSNDTGRYISNLHLYCRGAQSEEMAGREISYRVFYAVTSPACIASSDGVFLFEVAFFLPMAFLLFARWSAGTLIWSISLLFSVYGLELMTNAMRQSLGMLLFFGALTLAKKHKVKALVLAALAVAAHTSVIAFLPLAFWVSNTQLSRTRLLIVTICLILIGGATTLVNNNIIVDFFENANDLRGAYSLIYENELKISFQLFMALPLYMVYGLRRFFEKEMVSPDEHKGIIYSTVLLVSCYILFPYITYRYSIFAVAMQIFFVSLSKQHSVRIGAVALIGFLMHLIFMALTTDHFRFLFYK